jgi:hypothetical protein
MNRSSLKEYFTWLCASPNAPHHWHSGCPWSFLRSLSSASVTMDTLEIGIGRLCGDLKSGRRLAEAEGGTVLCRRLGGHPREALAPVCVEPRRLANFLAGHVPSARGHLANRRPGNVRAPGRDGFRVAVGPYSPNRSCGRRLGPLERLSVLDARPRARDHQRSDRATFVGDGVTSEPDRCVPGASATKCVS